jgi:DNA-binding MarR family transcriptional regulator
MTKMVARMRNKGYVEISTSGKDNRKKIISLSKKAKKELPKFEKIWSAGQKSIRQILENNKHFFESLEDFENQIRVKSFKDRALENLNND